MSNDEMTQGDYWREVRSIVDSLLEESHSDGEDREGLETRLWETIDGHQWVIYTAYNFDVMKHSPNDGYSAENFGADSIVKDGALDTAAIAFGALYADVSEDLWSRVEDCDHDYETDDCPTCGESGWYDSEQAEAA